MTTSPWRRLGRVGVCIADATGRYLLTWVAAWLVYALTAPRRHELVSHLPRTRSYWEDTATWFLLFQNFVALLFVPVLAQVVFALCLMPVPLVRFPAKAAN
ncbi:hypothetical protein ACFYWN_17825 [Streptomyces sp. NPDC002917]|uniref:hypothetical protein n=1 Tax=unclassified Streptomyces TaxID=2593676 RepID=UPI002E802D2F|nr:hypothetical protein [Streptomyces sp. NBC_00562]WUC21215.1 hypothetical protein OHA33_21425 [Streptomyces sp. NBC_00562]